MIFSLSPTARPRVQRAAEHALNILQSTEFHLALKKIKGFKDSKKTGNDLSVILSNYVNDPDLVIKIVMYYSRKRVNAYVNKYQPDIIKFNSRNDNRPIFDMAATIVHEFVHCADTLDPNDNTIDHGHRSNRIRYNYYCAPNTAARIAKQILISSRQVSIPEDLYLRREFEPDFEKLSLVKNQYIAIGEKGSLSDYGHYRTTPEDIDSIVSYLKENRIKKLALYCHGGLVNEYDGASAVSTVLSVLNKDKPDNMHSMGFIWKTGVGEIFEERMIRILSTGLFLLLINRLISYVRRRFGHSKFVSHSLLDGAQSLESDSKADFQIIQHYLDGKLMIEDVNAMEGELGFKGDNKANNKLFDSYDETNFEEELNKDAIGIVEEVDSLSDETIDSMWCDYGDDESINYEVMKDLLRDFDEHGILPRENDNKAINIIGRLRVVYRVIRGVYLRYRNNTWHGTHATVVEELLRALYLDDLIKAFWDEMKYKAFNMWEDNNAAHMLFSRINEECSDIEVDFIGHSAGAICGAGMLNYLSKQYSSTIKINSMNLLAPAINYSSFRDSYIKNRENYNSFTMYTMTDIAERRDNLIDKPGFRYLYPSSLLYLISGVMESKPDTRLVGMQRFGLDWYRNVHPGFDDVYEFLYEQSEIKFTPQGKYTVNDHGQFDDDTKVILPEIKTIIEQSSQ